MKISKYQAKQHIENSVGFLDRRMYNELGAYVALFFLTADNTVLAVSNKNASVMDDSYLNNLYISSPRALTTAKEEAIARIDGFVEDEKESICDLIDLASLYSYTKSPTGKIVNLRGKDVSVCVFPDGSISSFGSHGHGESDNPDSLSQAKQLAKAYIARAKAVENSVFTSITFEDHIPLTEQPALIEEASMKISEILNCRSVGLL